jgi:hypothetical protein
VTLRLFAFVHLNLAFSSIEESHRERVVRNCYWPLLRIARTLRVPFGIEASGYTLEQVERIDSSWLAELRALFRDGTCEPIGSGYSQLIGPLVPALVNDANLYWGADTYERLLGVQPRLALVNEQAYAAGLVPTYKARGYDALIMEWNNPAFAHSEWDARMRYLPQRALGPSGASIPVIWNESVAFQKFQRYAHGELELDEYLAYIRGHVGPEDRAFPVYGNDVEIFDFRPGRFLTEAPLTDAVEWKRIETLFSALREEPGTCIVKPSDVLSLASQPRASQSLQLESPAQPIPVKKQGKYNVLRWAVTGRDDLDINTRCWGLYETLRSAAVPVEDPRWKELCYLWSSDMRTHITPTRWEEFRKRLVAAESEWKTKVSKARATPVLRETRAIREEKNLLLITVGALDVTLNRRRGLAIDSLRVADVWPTPLCGTVPHGTYDDVRYSPDWYTGNLVFEAPAQHKVTDLEPATDVAWGETPEGAVEVRGVVPTQLGPVHKTLRFSGGGASGPAGVEMQFEADWPKRGIGSLRLGFITLLPGEFDERTLYYRTHNGGSEAERFALTGTAVNHGASVSALVSASHALGVTEGSIELGDVEKAIVVRVDKTASALVGMVEHRLVADKVFCQLVFSAAEIDDTRRPLSESAPPLHARFLITPRRHVRPA